MSRTFTATFTGFTGAQFAVQIRAYSLEEAIDTCAAHMSAGDILTVEEV